MQKNCGFYPSAAAAEAAGFRPCLKCRPELAPGFAVTEASAKLARAAACLIEDGVATDRDLAHVARRMGVTDRHLRRIFAEEFGVSPVQYAQTHRLLLAKRLLTDTMLPVSEVAFAAGFSSVRRMNALFNERYGFPPTRLREADDGNAPTRRQVQDVDGLTFVLPYRPPYDWPRALAFFAQRAVPGVEAVTDGVYRRVIRYGDIGSVHVTGWLEVSHMPNKNALQLRFAASLASAMQAVLSRTKQVFDVAADPQEICLALGDLAVGAPGLRLPGAFDGFELALRAILGQQVTVKAARTLATRFVDAFGAAVETPFADLMRAFPLAEQVAALSRDDIGRLGIVGQRAEAMIAIAIAVVEGRLLLTGNPEPTKIIEALRAIKGVGPWTAHYIAMRAIAWPDAWPPKDVALLNAMNLPNTAKGQREADAIAEAWRPWRSYAVLHTWRKLEAAIEK